MEVKPVGFDARDLYADLGNAIQYVLDHHGVKGRIDIREIHVDGTLSPRVTYVKCIERSQSEDVQFCK